MSHRGRAQLSPPSHHFKSVLEPASTARTMLARFVERVDLALALIEPARGRVIWCSQAFTRRCERLAPAFDGVTLASGPTALTAWLGAHDGTLQLGAAATEARLDVDGTTLHLQVSRLAVDVVGLRLEDEPAVDDALLDYLKEREGLFSTSRRITVSEMASALAHEINQPVGALVNLLSGIDRRLRRGDRVDERIYDALERALEQAWFTSRVITRIRDFTDARRPSREVLDVPTLLRSAIDLLDWLFEANRCGIAFEGPDPSQPAAEVIGDATMLQQVFVNLLRNAVEAMRDVPLAVREVRVVVRAGIRRVEVDITDRGHGLDGDEPFLPFATNKPDGMGIGLHICRSFVELHQGRLWLTANPAGGCTAHTSLPRHEAERPDAPVSIEVARAANSGGSSPGRSDAVSGSSVRAPRVDTTGPESSHRTSASDPGTRRARRDGGDRQ